jgi:Uma2 family endonuclease
MNTPTLQAVLEMPEERREFLEGEIFVPPAPEPLHQTTAFRFAFLVQTHLLQQPVGQLFLAPLDVVIEDTTTQPDFIFVAEAQKDIVREKRIEGAPVWLVEVVSPTSHKRDFETKKQYYLENGVEEYWVVSLEGRVVWVFTPDNLDGDVFGRGKLSPRCLPNLNLEVARLFV